MQIVIRTFILLLGPFLFLGIINRVKAMWAGRKGAPLLQPLFDFMKMLRKGEVISRTVSFVFKISPSVNISAVIFAFLLLPVLSTNDAVSFRGDFILFAYALGLARFFMIIAALDTGSSFEGMGASREITFSSIVEPAFFILIGTLALLTGQTSFASVFNLLNENQGYTILVKILFSISLYLMILTEGSRVPVDDPNTHLELTMIHEVMILDYSGPDLGYLLYASGMKMILFSILIADLLIPAGMIALYSIPLFFFILFIIPVSIGLIESLIARARMSRLPQFIFLITAFLLIAFAVVLLIIRGGI